MSSVIMLTKDVIVEVVATAKIPVSVAASTTTVGVVQMFSLIPDDIGKLAALIGAALSLALLTKVFLEIILLARRLKDKHSDKSGDDKDVDSK